MNAVIKCRKQNREDILYIHGNKCNICGYNKYNGALEFHHLDKNEKDFDVSSRNISSFERGLEESKKCILLCSNCHKEVHAGIIDVILKTSYDENAEKIIRSVRAQRQEQCNQKKYKVEHPSRDTLKFMVRNKTFVECEKIFGVSAAAIKKWLKKENLPNTKKEINKYTDEEWLNI